MRLSRVLHEVVRNFVLYPMSHRVVCGFLLGVRGDESCIRKEQSGIVRVCGDEEHQRSEKYLEVKLLTCREH